MFTVEHGSSPGGIGSAVKQMSGLLNQHELLRHVRKSRKEAFLFSLSDGHPLLLGTVIPEDQERIRIGLTRMSSISRYLRFFTSTSTLSAEQLQYLTEIDQVNHVAWCALDPATPELDGLGLGRFVRLQKQPDIAETALAVVDAYQGRGLGRILLGLLYLRAEEVGVRTLRGLVLPENESVQRWFRHLGATIRRSPGLNEMDLPVHSNLARFPKTSAAARFRKTLESLRQAKAQQR